MKSRTNFQGGATTFQERLQLKATAGPAGRTKGATKPQAHLGQDLRKEMRTCQLCVGDHTSTKEFQARPLNHLGGQQRVPALMADAPQTHQKA